MIIYFSGNGNSRHVAERLGELLADSHIVSIDAKLISHPEINLDENDGRIVWVLPVHAWGLPKAVKQFMRRLKIVDFKKAVHYLVVTCGDDTGYVDREWRRIARHRGWDTAGCWNVTMPNTYICLPGFDVDSESLKKRKLTESQSRICHVASAIAAASNDTDLFRGSVPWIKSYILRPLFMSALTSPRFFKVEADRCISCGKCAAVCPLKNVVLDSDGHPRWGKDCTMCLGCYNHCPKHAIDYGRATRHKGQYYF